MAHLSDAGGDDGPPPKPTVAEIVADLAAEHRALDDIVAGLPEAGWASPTPSAGWTVADQIGHLAYFDRAATLAATDAAGFAGELAAVMDAAGRGEGPMEGAVAQARLLGPEALLRSWRKARAALLAAAAALPDGARLPWYGPSMGTVSFLTARLMETWAHGQDVAEALGLERAATDRLRHVASLGVMTRAWSYTVRGAVVPAAEVGVRLRAPSGRVWQWHPGAGQSIEGDALDFCLVVTQRRHVADTGLAVDGEAAADWMQVAQAFAGAATIGPAARGSAHPTR
jgi:uncharacterized protein (TIGR03084 family)